MKKISYLALAITLISVSCHWSYEGRNGPQNWGNSEEFKFCKIGYNQSPIDVAATDFKNDELKFNYTNSDIQKRKTKHSMQFEFSNRDYVLRGRKKYFIRYVEFHHPSEHLIDASPHSLEMQIYHKSDDEQWLSLAIFLEIGEENSEFKKLTNLLLSRDFEGKLDLSKIANPDSKLFFYDGSFTTPPCKEGLKWYIRKTAIKISKEQMNKIIKFAIFSKSNARPIQEFRPEKF
jgi:carbonic anhydrase